MREHVILLRGNKGLQGSPLSAPLPCHPVMQPPTPSGRDPRLQPGVAWLMTLFT